MIALSLVRLMQTALMLGNILCGLLAGIAIERNNLSVLRDRLTMSLVCLLAAAMLELVLM